MLIIGESGERTLAAPPGAGARQVLPQKKRRGWHCGAPAAV